MLSCNRFISPPVHRATSLVEVGPGRGTPPSAADGMLPRAALVGLRVVMVEDELISALFLEEMLTALGVEVLGAASDEAGALDMIGRLRPDLVLMDIRLARGGDGVQAATEAFRRHAVRALFITAHTEEATRVRAHQAAPLGFLSKPFGPEQLRAALIAALNVLRAS